MIPKIIHYCWFGRNPLPQLAIRCIESWKKNLPDYEIKEWNEDNFDVKMSRYTKEAYDAKKYAFVSDYARFWILYHQGGLYFDTDVEVIKPLDDILANGNFMGFEQEPYRNFVGTVNPGLGFAMEKGHPFLKKMLDLYNTFSFLNPDGSLRTDPNVVKNTTLCLQECGLNAQAGNKQIVGGIHIYPKEFFSPTSIITDRTRITNNTHTIHRYAGSWVDKTDIPFKQRIKFIFPESFLLWFNWYKHHRE